MRLRDNVEEELAKLPPEQRKLAEEKIQKLAALIRRNPLMGFQPNSQAQADFLRARTHTIAAIAGNQFGKTTSLVVRSLIMVLPEEFLPEWMRPLKWWDNGPIHGRLVCPSTALLEQNFVPTFREWCPPAALAKGSIDKAWNGQKHILTFADGSFIDFLSYEMDLDKFGSVRRHFVGYDEPPPSHIRDEGLARIMRYAGFEMFAFTPLKNNTGWLRREIYKKREDPDITVVRGSVRDNQMLDDAAREKFLSGLPSDLWRRAREFGDFVEVGGMIYPDFERCIIPGAPDPAWVREQRDIVIAIDPGRRNAGIAFLAFDGDNSATMFDEGKLQDKGPKDYAEFIRARMRYWGIDERHVHYVCDPSYRQRGIVTSETVMAALIQEGIYANPGQNDVPAGIDQMRTRMQHGRFHVYESCRHIRDEADDYAAEEPDEGKDDSELIPIKGNDHVLDATRYGVMERFWDPAMEDDAPKAPLGYGGVDEEGEQHWEAPVAGALRSEPDIPPMGFMS